MNKCASFIFYLGEMTIIPLLLSPGLICVVDWGVKGGLCRCHARLLSGGGRGGGQQGKGCPMTTGGGFIAAVVAVQSLLRLEHQAVAEAGFAGAAIKGSIIISNLKICKFLFRELKNIFVFKGRAGRAARTESRKHFTLTRYFLTIQYLLV